MGQLYSITPFTLLDFPNEMACIVWLAGCNMRCRFCHNPDIVTGKGQKEDSELLDFLKTRQGKLTGVVFSGGEPTLYAGLKDLMVRVKELGFKIKLDTNGSRPEVLCDLLALDLLDYVAMDFKCPPEKMESLIGTGKHWPAFQESLKMMIEATGSGRLVFEVRTTYHADLMDEDDLHFIIKNLDGHGYKGTYYIQNIASVGEKTIGNIDKPTRELDQSALPQPKNYNLSYRNFS